MLEFLQLQNPPAQEYIPQVSTRLKEREGNTENSYKVEGKIPGFSTNKPPKEIVICVHGFNTDEEWAQKHFHGVNRSLNQLGYNNPLIGFTWEGDIGLLRWYEAKKVAENNGKNLAQFIVDYKLKCKDTKIRLIGYSLGARVVLYALKSLNEDHPKWKENNWKVRSVHMIGAAVDDEEVTRTEDNFGFCIENEADEFHNKYNPKDDVLQYVYSLVELDHALGKLGAPKENRPKNYKQENVEEEIIKDLDGDGIDENENTGDNHGGYIGIMSDGVLVDNGAMEKIYKDWQNQDPENKRNCFVAVVLEKIVHEGNDLGGKWSFSVSAGGDYLKIPFHKKFTKLRPNESLTGAIVMPKRDMANVGDNVKLDIRCNANQFAWKDDFGSMSKVYEFKCKKQGESKFNVTVNVKERKKTAKIKFFFKVSTEEKSHHQIFAKGA